MDIKTYLLGKPVHSVTALLDPGLEISESSATVANHEFIVVEELGRQQVNQCRDNNDGVANVRLTQGVPKENQISGLGIGNRLILGVSTSRFHSR